NSAARNCPALFRPSYSSHHTPPTEIYTLSLHDALPISALLPGRAERERVVHGDAAAARRGELDGAHDIGDAVRDGRVEAGAVGALHRAVGLDEDRKSVV